MTMPWTCDATKPFAERVSSLKYLRVARSLNYARISYEDAAELVAFLQFVPHNCARWIFQWDARRWWNARQILKHLSVEDALVQRMVHENHMGLVKADGLAVLRAMQEGGWVRGPLPPVVRDAMRDLRSDGLSQPEIGRRLGLTLDQVREARAVRKPVSLKDAALFAV